MRGVCARGGGTAKGGPGSGEGRGWAPGGSPGPGIPSLGAVRVGPSWQRVRVGAQVPRKRAAASGTGLPSHRGPWPGFFSCSLDHPLQPSFFCFDQHRNSSPLRKSTTSGLADPEWFCLKGARCFRFEDFPRHTGFLQKLVSFYNKQAWRNARADVRLVPRRGSREAGYSRGKTLPLGAVLSRRSLYCFFSVSV